MEIKNTNGSQEGAYTPEPRVYEIGYHILSTVDEGDVEKEREALVALITQLQGTVISEEMPALINLAYEMDKIINNKRSRYNQAYFGWIKFELSPEAIATLEKEVETMDSILRFLIVKTLRENTIVSETPYKLARSHKKNEEEVIEEDDVERPVAETSPTEEKEDLTSSEDGEAETAEAKEAKEEEGVADDLTKIEGIGPKIAEIFNNAGIKTFEDLSSSKVADLRNILAENKLSSHDPKTWSKQATLAKHGKWDELKKLQDELNGGK